MVAGGKYLHTLGICEMDSHVSLSDAAVCVFCSQSNQLLRHSVSEHLQPEGRLLQGDERGTSPLHHVFIPIAGEICAAKYLLLSSSS